MKKISFFLLVTFIFSLFTSAHAYSINPQNSTIMYTRNRVYVREEATVDSSPLGILDFGISITTFSSKKDVNGKEWIYASTPYGEGYVSAFSLSLIKQEEATDYKIQEEHDNVFEVKNVVSSKSLSLITIMDAPARESNGNIFAIVPQGKTFSTNKIYIFNGQSYAEVWYHGKAYYISTSNASFTSGKNIPYLSGTIQLIKNCYIEGMIIESGKQLNVKYYILGSDGIVYAYCYEGFIPASMFKRI